jgi:tetratricopeptide (TPR) repeat protein
MPARRSALPLVLALPALLAAASPPPGPADWRRHLPFSARADLAWAPDRIPAFEALLDSAAAVARARGDDGLGRVVATQRLRVPVANRVFDAAVADGTRLLAEAEGATDTLSACLALRSLATAENARRRLEAARSHAERLVELGRRAGLAEEQGRGWILLGYQDLADSQLDRALEEFGHALSVLDRQGDPRVRASAQAGLARTHQIRGDYASARRAHLVSLDDALRRRDRWQQSETLANLGSLEHAVGDPALAVRYYAQAESLGRAIGREDVTISCQRNLALLHINLGALDEADSVLARLLPAAERSRDAQVRAAVYSQFGVLRRQQGRLNAAVEYGQRAVALSDSIPISSVTEATRTLSATLERAGRCEEALAMLDRQTARVARRSGGGTPDPFALQRARCLRGLARPREALAALPRPDRTQAHTGVSGYTGVQLRVEIARCQRELGQLDSALVWYRDAVAAWEAARRGTAEASWREAFDNAAGDFSGELATLLLEPARGGSAESRAREAFAAMQRFRSRTLLERVLGPGAAATAAFGVVEASLMQQRVLDDGELLLDLHLTDDTTVVFLLTRQQIRAYLAPGGRVLRPHLVRLRARLADPGGPAGAADAAARDLGRDLLGPATAELGGARRVLLSSGSYAQYPLAALFVPGASEPLGVAHEVAQAPSAALLAAGRRLDDPAVTPARLLAIARTRDEQGRTLPGAAREARDLAARYRGAEARVDGGITPQQLGGDALAGFEVLHFAAHTRTDTRQPWRSGMLLGDPREPDPWLRADAIAALRVPARLCVLSSCRSIGGRDAPGETLQGLAAAWLAAGVPAVIATQWDADDRALGELMRHFYDHLARGETAAAALRDAQGALRADRRWAAPYFWQGVVLLGDPRTRVPLARRG